MKKLAILTALAAVLVLSTAAFAAFGTPATYIQELDGSWTTPADGLYGVYAKAFTSEPAAGICDAKDWVTKFTNHVTVSQWIDYSFSGSRWDWQIRKPGKFAADCISFSIRSNDDVDVAFDGFADLAPLLHTDGSAAPIAVWYNYQTDGVDTPPADGWLTASALNGSDFQLSYAQVKDGFTKKLWNMIDIPRTQRACDYEDSGTITLTLTDVKYFIDPLTGDYNGLLPDRNPKEWLLK